jgi:hypothetical protein
MPLPALASNNCLPVSVAAASAAAAAAAAASAALCYFLLSPRAVLPLQVLMQGAALRKAWQARSQAAVYPDSWLRNSSSGKYGRTRRQQQRHDGGLEVLLGV